MSSSRQEILESLPANLQPPKNCPCCSTPLVIQDAWVACPNFHCNNRVYGRLQKFINVLDIKGAGIETLRGMVELGMVKSAGDLFRVTEEQFCKLDRKGEKHFDKFKQGLELVRKMRPAQIFAALDIEGTGTWDAICAVPGLQTPTQVLTQAKANNYHLFANAVRVSPDKAQRIISEILERESEVVSLIGEIVVKETGTKLLGKTFCLTGSLSQPRPKIVERIKGAGGSVASDVSTRVDYLVTDDLASGSSKNKKAKQLNVRVINETELDEMFN